ncbi:MAG: NAD(P)/FAD-dependent oxidoreductase [Vicinamibacterales bacterium]
MKLKFAPFWSDRFPRSRRPAFPRQRGQIDTQVVVIGGGLTGCACASAFAAARLPVVLVEADRIGSGATAGALGLVREDFDVPFNSTVSAHGLRAARILWQTTRRAGLELQAALRRLHVRCDLLPRDLLHVAQPDRMATRDVRREYDSRREAGLDHRWLSAAAVAREAAIESGGGIRTRAALLDPYRACIGLASSAADRGAAMFERSEVRRIRTARKHVEVHTSGGVVRAATVVVATGAPIRDLRQLRRHLHPRHGYGVVTEPLPAGVRRQVGQRRTTLRDMAVPPHFVRWLSDDRVLVAGADQDPIPGRARRQVLSQRAGQLMYELSLIYPAISGARAEWAWSYPFDDTVDGLPYIGTHRNFPRHLFALGLGRHGAGAAWLAARLLLRHLLEQPARGDDLFGFSRILSGR